MTDDATIAILPDDIWLNIVPFVELSSLPQLQCTSQRFKHLFSSQAVYRIWSELRYPKHTLLKVEEHYNGSWEALLKDDNAQGGVYVFRTLDIGQWKGNGCMSFYMNAIRYLIWDRRAGQVIVVVEAFGMLDLRAAHPSKFTKPYTLEKNLVNTQTYQLHAFCFPQNYFKMLQAGAFEFTYACRGHGRRFFGAFDDYHAVNFGSHFATPFLTQSFCLKNTNCTFEARGSKFVEVSDPKTWPIQIPNQCLNLMAQGQWGSSGLEIGEEEAKFDVLF